MTVSNQAIQVKFTEDFETQNSGAANRPDGLLYRDMTRHFKAGETFSAIVHAHDGTYRIAAKSDQGDQGMYVVPAELVEEL
jgi:hypothetical protein